MMRCLLLIALVCCSTATRAQWPGAAAPSTPHPAVARIKVPEADGVAYGSGTLVDVREDYGLVLTNWHVVHGAVGPIEVKFPSGFVSQARSLKMDSEWDLAALVIWKPSCQPVRLATRPPRPGDRLTICGYGSGNYRAATGRCTQFYAPRLDLPQELVELDVQARQGDSGGPIFNDRGEMAGVLFGAGQGTTLGSFEGRVKTFLASLAPDIGQQDSAPQVALKPTQSMGGTCPTCPTCPNCQPGVICEGGVCRPRGDLGDVCFGCDSVAEHAAANNASGNDWPDPNTAEKPALNWSSSAPGDSTAPPDAAWPPRETDQPTASGEPAPSTDELFLGNSLFDNIRNGLAIVGLLAILMQVLRVVG
ncbi:S1 family peptidase [Aeoliella sp.]|uniref:S1 family peptidase n=1 Tax=Aeoliella sp. TaxID=2795800 RepID=UPI003CCC223F